MAGDGDPLYAGLVVLLILVYVWRIQDLFPVLAAVQLPILSSLAALAVFVINGHAAVASARFRSPILVVATFIFCWMLVSTLGSVYPGLTFRFIIEDHVKTYLMMVLVLASIRRFADVERLIVTNIVGAVLYCGVILTRFDVGSSGRLGDLYFYDSNDLAMLVACSLPLAVYFLRSGAAMWQRGLALLAGGIFVVAIVRTGSRGGFLALLGIGLFLLLFFRAVKGYLRWGAVVLTMVTLLAVAGDQYWHMMGTMLNPKEDYNWSGNNEVGRMAIWERGMGYMASRPLTGIGANAFPVAEGMLSPLAARQNMGQGLKWSAAHNSFVQIGAELGIPGLIAFVLLLYRLFATGWRVGKLPRALPFGSSSRALGQALVASLVGFAIAGFFLSQAYSAFLYSICALVVGLAYVVGEPRTMRAGDTGESRARGGARWQERPPKRSR